MFDQLALLAQALTQNPAAGAQALAATGVPPPGATQPMPSFVPPAMAQMAANNELGGLLAGSGYPTPLSPAQAGMKDPAAAANDPMALLKGFKAPQVDNKPIMNAGVSGSQRAPEVTVGAGKGSGAIQALMGLVGNRPAASPIPDLATLLRGIG